MTYRKIILAHNSIIVACQKIIHITNLSGTGIFKRQHAKISFFICNCLHNLLEVWHMKICCQVSKICHRSSMTVCSLYSLKYNSCIYFVNLIHTVKWNRLSNALFLHDLILTLAANCHDLCKQIADAMFFKTILCKL